MPQLVEYRIPFPATVEEYRVGMMYMIARASEDEMRRGGGGGGAVELVRHETFADDAHGLGAGIYTEKVYHVERFLPRFLRPLVPAASARVVEKAWASYPNRCLTLYFCPYLGARSFMSIESRYLPDRGETSNALQLGADELAARQVVVLDVAGEGELRAGGDAGARGARAPPAAGPRARREGPGMCCYKVCRLDIAAPRVEAWCQRFLHNSFIRHHRQALLRMDSWFGLRLQDIPGALPAGAPAAARPPAAAPARGLAAAADLFDRADRSSPFA